MGERAPLSKICRRLAADYPYQAHRFWSYERFYRAVLSAKLPAEQDHRGHYSVDLDDVVTLLGITKKTDIAA
jgi:hypothetical protein